MKTQQMSSFFSNSYKEDYLFRFRENKKQMTLVYRTPKQQLIKPVHQLGPGSYNIGQKNTGKNQKNTKSCVFASSSNRDPFETRKYQKELSEKEKSQTKTKQPEYQESTTSQIQNPSNIIRPKKSIDCSYVFNSKVERFETSKQESQQKFNQILLVEEFKKLLLKDMATNSKGKLLKAKDKLERQKEIEKNHQAFPSIPNWNNSYGYRYDSETNKWVSNQNPKLMEMMMEKDRENQKVNHALGPGCYIYNPNKEAQKQKKFKEQKNTRKSTDLMDSFTRPTIKPQTPIHNSIEEDLNKKKLRIRLLGHSPITKIQQLISKSKNSLLLNYPNLEGKNKKEVLLLSQIHKKFRQYIPKDQQNSPSKFFEKIKQKKRNSHQTQQTLQLKDVSNTHQYFLSKSQRFDFETKQSEKEIQENTLVSQQNFDQTINSSALDNSSVNLKSHNCKQPYSLGEDRFKQMKTKQNLGPGTYNYENFQNTKLPPCLNLKEERFDQKRKNSNLPGPGEYNVSQQLVKKQNHLSEAFSYYKKIKSGEIQKSFKKQDSMESLYQAWGRQMNYMVKMEHQPRPQENQEIEKTLKANENEEKSLIKVKKQLEASLKQFSSTQSNSQVKVTNTFTNERIASTVQLRSVSEKAESKSPPKIYPKITKHLYQYKQLPPNNKQRLRGPGKYETRKDLVKKTFNVTYT